MENEPPKARDAPPAKQLPLDDEARRIIQEYADNLREIVRMLRRYMS